MKGSTFFAKFTLIIISILIIGLIVATSLFSSPSKKSVLSTRPGEKDNKIESIIIKKDEKRKGKTGTYVHISDASEVSSLKEYARISNLYISNTDGSALTDINGMEIHSLVLQNVSNFDLSLPDIKNLFSVTLINSPVKDFSPLKDADNLSALSITNTEFQKGDFLKYTPHLKELSISDSKLKDISFLKHTPKLEKLSVYNCGIQNISGAEKLTELKELSLSSNSITDISPISNLKNLRTIVMDHNDIQGEADFSKMENLAEIYLPFNRLKGIKIHSDATPYVLNLSYNEITEIPEDFINTISKTDCRVNLFGNLIANHNNLKNISNFIYQHNETSKTFTYDEHNRYTQAVKDFRKKYIKPEWSELKKAAFCFCVLSGQVRYFHNYSSSSLKEADYVHTEYGALINKMAVCDGLSYALRDILRHEGIKSYIYHGDINSQSDDITHAWNVIYIDSKPYHCDLTAGITKENNSSKFKYYDIEGYIDDILSAFGKSDIYMESNGYFLTDKNAPKCTENITPSSINNIVYEICESDEKYHFIDKDIFIEKGVIKDE